MGMPTTTLTEKAPSRMPPSFLQSISGATAAFSLSDSILGTIVSAGTILAVTYRVSAKFRTWFWNELSAYVNGRIVLNFFPVSPYNRPFWVISRNSPPEQFRLDGHWSVVNASKRNVGIMQCYIRKPRIDGMVSCPDRDDMGRLISTDAELRAGEKRTLHASFDVEAAKFPGAKQGEPIKATVVFVDHRRHEHPIAVEFLPR